MKTNTTNTKPAYEPNLSERLHGLRRAVDEALTAKEHEDFLNEEAKFLNRQAKEEEDFLREEAKFLNRQTSWQEEELRQAELYKWKTFARAAYDSAIASGEAIKRKLESLRSEHREMITALEKEEDAEQIPF
jgi:hypothetical protein